jgi:hypothetical protein
MVRLSGALIDALRGLLQSPSIAGLGPIELARVLGVDKSFTSRLMSALRATDPLVALSLLPGVVPTRQFITAAHTHGANTRVVQSAERALRAFDHELVSTFGTRTRLDAMLTDALPEARRRHEDVARQSVYRGMAMIRGISIDLEHYTWIAVPSAANAKSVDLVFIGSFVGVHRLRPTARFRAGAAHAWLPGEANAKLLRKFCRPADMSITISTEKDYTYYELASGSMRRDSAANVFLTEFMSQTAPRSDPAEDGVWSISIVLQYPVKRAEMVLLVHPDVWQGCDFSVRVYDTSGRGPVHLPDPERDPDVLPTDARVVNETIDAETLRDSAVPNYAEIVRHVLALHGSTLAAPGGTFRRIRCELAYPLYGSQISLVREPVTAKSRAPRRRRP